MKRLWILLSCFLLTSCVSVSAKYQLTLSDFVKSDHSPIVKIDNPLSKDITINELNTFLQNYNSEKHSFANIPSSCGLAAEDLHNKAEAQDIRAAIVCIDTGNNTSHIFNLFQTDKGKIYVDATEGKTVIAEMDNGKYKVIRYLPNQIQIQSLGKEQDFLIFW